MMHWGLITQYGLLVCYLGVFVTTFPAFVRLIRNRPLMFDPIKACCGILAATLINNFLVRDEKGFSLMSTDNIYIIVSAILTGVAFTMVLVALLKTEKAIYSAGKP